VMRIIRAAAKLPGFYASIPENRAGR